MFTLGTTTIYEFDGGLKSLWFYPLMVAYLASNEAIFGATIGKRLLSAQVLSASGGRLPLGRALARNSVKPIEPLIGLVLALFSPLNRSLGDHIAGSVVVSPQVREASPPRPVDVTQLRRFFALVLAAGILLVVVPISLGIPNAASAADATGMYFSELKAGMLSGDLSSVYALGTSEFQAAQSLDRFGDSTLANPPPVEFMGGSTDVVVRRWELLPDEAILSGSVGTGGLTAWLRRESEEWRVNGWDIEC